MTTPDVSVVVPAHNEAACIERCLASLQTLDYPRERYEIIVVDNRSTDATAERARREGVAVIPEPKPGAGAARNAGVRAARGDLIAFMDADCVADRAWLQELMAGAADRRVGCVVGDILTLNGGRLIPDFVDTRRLICQARLLASSPPVAAGGNIAYRKEVFTAIGGFDESFLTGEDGDLFWRMIKTDRFHVRYARAARVYHPHPTRFGTLVKRAFMEGRGLAQFRRRHAADIPAHMTSFPRVVLGFVSTVGGCLAYPLRVSRHLQRGFGPGRSFAYPFLDKAYSICRTAGITYQFARIDTDPGRHG